jgi:1-acyl-sn-glycerol-3-phosphate acyltransferase
MLPWVRTYIITPPFSAACFASFWLSTLVSSWFDRSGNSSHGVARFWSRMLLRTAGIRVVAEGLDRLPRDGAFVYVSNHLSLADTPLMAGWLPTSFRFLAKESLMRVPIIGGHLRRGGHIPVERDDARAAVRSLARAEKLLRDARISVLVFAEGTRSRDGDLQVFKAGAAHLAIKSGAPVVPIAVHGTAEVMPKGRKLLRPGVIRLLAGDPIPTAGLKAHDRDRFTLRLQAHVSELLDRVVQIQA